MAKLIFCNQENREKNSKIAPHQHHCHELVLYNAQASGVTVINGVTYPFSAGSIALIPRGTVHSEEHFTDNPVIFLGFESPANVFAGVWEDMDHLRSLFNDIAQEVRNQEWGYERMISLKLEEILGYIERRMNGVSGTVKDLAYSKRYIEENYMQNISVSDLASMTCYSKDRFRHLFTEKFGISPKNYLMQLRLENAKRLLETTDSSCIEIAFVCGFSDAGQMTKMIRQKYGMTPRQLKQV